MNLRQQFTTILMCVLSLYIFSSVSSLASTITPAQKAQLIKELQGPYTYHRLVAGRTSNERDPLLPAALKAPQAIQDWSSIYDFDGHDFKAILVIHVGAIQVLKATAYNFDLSTSTGDFYIKFYAFDGTKIGECTGYLTADQAAGEPCKIVDEVEW